MWDSRYRREDSNEGFRLSPCLTASLRLLKPPLSYNMDARRGLAASTMSPLSPTTPNYGQNPYTNHGYVGVQTLPMEYTFKASGSEGAPYEAWPTFAQPDSANHNMPMSMHDSYASLPTLLPFQMITYAEVNDISSSVPVTGADSFSSVPYADFNGHMNDNMNQIGANGESIEYVHVDTANAEVEMGAYDDVSVPLAPPQDVIVKQENLENSEDEKRMKRSIWVSSTGGKSLCHTQFNRNDNCWEHYWTHVHRPGKTSGRNKKRSLRRVLTSITDPKHAGKLLNKWKKEVGYEYNANNDPQAQDESDDDFVLSRCMPPNV
ncbi:hypothetical protein GQ44DRAFT_746346 [Phaeosphaeriaceae sp. PMI808]|nr:hypothetical protein GQ44DRAFT_746346 [Phaeosphaeriaceae sp. PMI808]